MRNLEGSCPDLRFTLNGRVIVTSNETKFKGGNCRSLRNGDAVVVKGVRMSDDTVRAEQVDKED